MSQEVFNAAFKGSPIKRAKLRGVKRNGAVVVGNVGTRVLLKLAHAAAQRVGDRGRIRWY